MGDTGNLSREREDGLGQTEFSSFLEPVSSSYPGCALVGNICFPSVTFTSRKKKKPQKNMLHSAIRLETNYELCNSPHDPTGLVQIFHMFFLCLYIKAHIFKLRDYPTA